MYEVPANTPEPYLTYVDGRNSAIARHIGDILGAKEIVRGFSGDPRDSNYFLPYSPYTPLDQERRGIEREDEFYGAVLHHPLVGDKVTLHPLIGRAPRQFERSVAENLAAVNAVLPGYSIFTQGDAIRAFTLLKEQGHDVRLKDPTQSDYNGQYRVEDEVDLRKSVAAVQQSMRARGIDLHERGLVLEANLSGQITTTSVGSLLLGGEQYSFIADQKCTSNNGAEVFGGSRMRVVRGGPNNLLRATHRPNEILTIQQAVAAHGIYEKYERLESRFSFDILQGADPNGQLMSGVIDTTFRSGGLTAGEVLAIKAFHTNPCPELVTVDINLEYSPVDDTPKGSTIFLDHPDLRITAQVI